MITIQSIPNRLSPRLKLATLVIFFSLFSAVSMLGSLPSVQTQGRDNGIFSYTAQVIAEGGVPYKDALDNKLPVTYYANAAAFLVFGANRWSSWIAEWVFVAATAIFFYLLMMQLQKRVWLGLLVTCFFVLQSRHPGFVDDGNFTGSYALLFQVMGFWAGYHFFQTPNLRWGFVLGWSAGMAFLTKQNTIAFCLTFVPIVLLTNHPTWRQPQRWQWLGSMIVGGLSMPLLLGMYLAAAGAWQDTVDGTLIFPGAFHDWMSLDWYGGNPSVLETIKISVENETFEYMMLPLIPFFFIGLVVAGLGWRWRERSYCTFEWWVLATFALDFILMNITARAYFHYYITPLAPLLMTVMFILNAVFDEARQIKPTSPPTPSPQAERGSKIYRYGARVLQAVALIYLLAVSLSAVNAMRDVIEAAPDGIFGEAREKRFASWIEENTEVGDTVLIWGASSDLNFQSNRRSPTNYHYAYPLIVPDYTTDEMLDDFLGDLERNQPVMIVDTSLIDGDRVPPLRIEDRAEWWINKDGRKDVRDLSKLFDWVADHCEVRYHTNITVYNCFYDQPATQSRFFPHIFGGIG